MVYADNAATTKMSRTAIDAMLPYMETHYGNPSSLYRLGQEAAEALQSARETVAACLGCTPREITFTSGGSEADNQALISAARIGERKGKKHIISTAFEHHAILHTLKKLEKEGFEAVFIGSGAGLPKFMGIPGENANGVLSANEYLTRNNLMKAFRDDYDTPIMESKKVVVVGGGNVAMDAARTALRLGAEVHIVYRRSEKELPARVEEVHHAKEEGIHFDLLTNPVEILEDENGWVKGIVCRHMELGEPDESGRRRPVEVVGSDFTIDADTVIMALGTSPNPLISNTTKGLEINRWRCIVADESNGKTTKEGVYAGGDAVTGAATVILAMEAGRAGARGIDEYLSAK